MSKFMNVPSKEGLRPLFPYKRYASIQCAALCLALTALVSCSSEKKPGGETASENPAKPTAKVAQYDTGRIAFQRMFLSARGWAGDAKPFRLQSQYTLDAPTSEGKAGLWRASFASPSRRMMKLFVWSGGRQLEPQQHLNPAVRYRIPENRQRQSLRSRAEEWRGKAHQQESERARDICPGLGLGQQSVGLACAVWRQSQPSHAAHCGGRHDRGVPARGEVGC